MRNRFIFGEDFLFGSHTDQRPITQSEYEKDSASTPSLYPLAIIANYVGETQLIMSSHFPQDDDLDAAEQVYGPGGRPDAQYSGDEVLGPVHAQLHGRQCLHEEGLLIGAPGAPADAVRLHPGQHGPQRRGGERAVGQHDHHPLLHPLHNQVHLLGRQSEEFLQVSQELGILDW